MNLAGFDREENDKRGRLSHNGAGFCRERKKRIMISVDACHIMWEKDRIRMTSMDACLINKKGIWRF